MVAKKSSKQINKKTYKRKRKQRKSNSSCNKRKRTGNCVDLKSVIRRIKRNIHQHKPKNVTDAILVALKTAKNVKQKIKSTPRIVQIPKTGGILPLIPIFAGLSALGALSGGAAGIAKAVNDAKAARQQLEESERHNKTMESIAMGKGAYLKPYKSGLGLFLRPAQASKNFP